MTDPKPGETGKRKPRDPGNALALLAIVVGATAQLTASTGPYTLWSSVIGLTLLAVVLAYRDAVGTELLERVAFASILGYTLVYAFGPIIDGILIERMVGPFSDCACWLELSRGPDRGCIAEPRGAAVFGIWFATSAVVFIARRKSTVS